MMSGITTLLYLFSVNRVSALAVILMRSATDLKDLPPRFSSMVHRCAAISASRPRASSEDAGHLLWSSSLFLRASTPDRPALTAGSSEVTACRSFEEKSLSRKNLLAKESRPVQR